MNSDYDGYFDQCLTRRDNITMAGIRITGGIGAKPGDNPWLASFLLTRGNYHQPCTGSLINRCWVLSAASCFEYQKITRHYLIRIGEYYRGNATQFNAVQSIHESKIKKVRKEGSDTYYI